LGSEGEEKIPDRRASTLEKGVGQKARGLPVARERVKEDRPGKKSKKLKNGEGRKG